MKWYSYLAIVGTMLLVTFVAEKLWHGAEPSKAPYDTTWCESSYECNLEHIHLLSEPNEPKMTYDRSYYINKSKKRGDLRRADLHISAQAGSGDALPTLDEYAHTLTDPNMSYLVCGDCGESFGGDLDAISSHVCKGYPVSRLIHQIEAIEARLDVLEERPYLRIGEPNEVCDIPWYNVITY